MDLGDFILEVAANYDRLDGLLTPTQELLRSAPTLLEEHVAPGISVKSGGGKGMATFTPWVGFFDPDETDSPQRGMYVVYIFSQDLERVALTLNQGMEYLRKEKGDAEARKLLARQATLIRHQLEAEGLAAPEDNIELRSRGERQLAYQAGNIACQMYSTGSLPDEAELRHDLRTMLDLYESGIRAKRSLLLHSEATGIDCWKIANAPENSLADFRPKDHSDYVSHMQGRTLIKSRKHELLVKQYADSMKLRGWNPSTPHPQDLVLTRQGEQILIEAKIIRSGNATDAVPGGVGGDDVAGEAGHQAEGEGGPGAVAGGHCPAPVSAETVSAPVEVPSPRDFPQANDALSRPGEAPASITPPERSLRRLRSSERCRMSCVGAGRWQGATAPSPTPSTPSARPGHRRITMTGCST